MATFLFLEITDRDINYLFNGLHVSIYDEIQKRAPHLTVRGPYKSGVSEETLRECRGEMKGSVLEISGVGSFSNANEEVVYISVNNPSLRRIWWKPDFPISQYGFNPHLSIYRGGDRQLATKIRRFLEHEQLRLLCSEYRLVTHVTHQLELPCTVPAVPRALVASGRVDAGLLNRLGVVVMRHRRT